MAYDVDEGAASSGSLQLTESEDNSEELESNAHGVNASHPLQASPNRPLVVPPSETVGVPGFAQIANLTEELRQLTRRLRFLEEWKITVEKNDNKRTELELTEESNLEDAPPGTRRRAQVLPTIDATAIRRREKKPKGRAEFDALPTNNATPRMAKAEAVEDLLDLDKAPPRKDTKAAPATRKRPKSRREADIDAPPTKDTKAAPGTRRRAKVGTANRNEDNLEASAQILIERDRSLIKLMKGKALDAQLRATSRSQGQGGAKEI
ncbi:hypothetical protein B0H14DRAFT_3874120 [Mycena olivaceomarginata]|nr:hypothetical protein B0H14DRAFT_3874120 [Mycena olivaceomarginata]